MAQHMALLFILFVSSSTSSMAAYNIVNFGAKPDGRTDCAGPLLRVWAAVCAGRKPGTIYIPQGRFFVSEALFQGPCNAPIKMVIKGTVVARAGYGSSTKWLYIKNVNGLSIYGGTLDGQGQGLWTCKLAGRSCPTGATTLSIGSSMNILISRLTLLNSEMFHMFIQNSVGITVRGAKISAPANSPNTDGISIDSSTGVTITGSAIQTGDDCISIKSGTSNVWIERVGCGPGHGISIGSLGDEAEPAFVQNITVKLAAFTGTQNGFRIKTWAKSGKGSVKDISFRNAVMKNVQNPIIIDQKYCPDNYDCPNQNSGIQISKVSFGNIQGTSATPVAVNLDCSATNKCIGVKMQNIKLTYGSNRPAQSFCKNVWGSASGTMIPPSCIQIGVS